MLEGRPAPLLGVDVPDAVLGWQFLDFPAVLEKLLVVSNYLGFSVAGPGGDPLAGVVLEELVGVALLALDPLL